jgi:phosphate transport system substrate-binding protein
MGSTRQTLAIIALTTTLMSCSGQEIPATTPTMAGDALRISATTAALPLMIDLTTSYSSSYPLINFDTRHANYQTMLSELLDDDMSYFFTNHLPADSPLWAAPIGQSGIIIIVHPDIALDGLSTEELRAIYQGRITSWDEVGADGGDIAVFSRENGSGTRAEFERMVMGRRPTTPNARIAPSNARMIESVLEVAGSIGYVSLGYVDERANTIAIDGINPTREAFYLNRYPLRSILFIVGLTEPEGEYRAFIAWIQGPAGQAVVSRRYVPLVIPDTQEN